jgi:hypothetical protein
MKYQTVLLVEIDGTAWPEPLSALGIGHQKKDLVLVGEGGAVEYGCEWEVLTIERKSKEEK